MGIPLLWMVLSTAGNSNTSERTELLDRLRAAFPDMKIAALMGGLRALADEMDKGRVDLALEMMRQEIKKKAEARRSK